jgi:uncharacterized protein (UPF0305 family)
MKSRLPAYLLRAFGMDNSHILEIPRHSVDIIHYCQYLQAEYKNATIERMNGIQVTDIKLYKTQGQTRHEYISANIRTGDSRFHLAIERRCGETTSHSEDDAESASQTMPTSTSLTSLNSFLVCGRPTTE